MTKFTKHLCIQLVHAKTNKNYETIVKVNCIKTK